MRWAWCRFASLSARWNDSGTMGAGDPEVTATGAMEIVALPAGNGPPGGPGLDVRSPVDGSWWPRCLTTAPRRCARPSREQQAWEALGAAGRREWVGRLRDWLLDNDERLELLQAETGKPWQEATVEVPLAVQVLEYYRKRADRFLAESRPRPPDLLTGDREPDRVGAGAGNRASPDASFAPRSHRSSSPPPRAHRCRDRSPAWRGRQRRPSPHPRRRSRRPD